MSDCRADLVVALVGALSRQSAAQVLSGRECHLVGVALAVGGPVAVLDARVRAAFDAGLDLAALEAVAHLATDGGDWPDGLEALGVIRSVHRGMAGPN